jgi:hypothetical protein
MFAKEEELVNRHFHSGRVAIPFSVELRRTYLKLIFRIPARLRGGALP